MRTRRAGGAPPSRERIPPESDARRTFTFIAPLGFVQDPVTRAHVRLLGPCFKTGRTGSRPIRHVRADARPPGPTAARVPGALRTVHQSRTRGDGPGPDARFFLGLPAGLRYGTHLTALPKERGYLVATGLPPRGRPVVALARESAPADGRRAAGPVVRRSAIRTPAAATARRAEFPGRLRGPVRLTLNGFTHS